MTEPIRSQLIAVEVNGERHERDVEVRRLLVHFLRDDLDLTGTHVGCDTGNCGACTILFNGAAVKSCMPSSRLSPSTTRSSAATAHQGC